MNTYAIDLTGTFRWKGKRIEDTTGGFVRAWAERLPKLWSVTNRGMEEARCSVGHIVDDSWTEGGVSGSFRIENFRVEAANENDARRKGKRQVKEFMATVCRAPELTFYD